MRIASGSSILLASLALSASGAPIIDGRNTAPNSPRPPMPATMGGKMNEGVSHLGHGVPRSLGKSLTSFIRSSHSDVASLPAARAETPICTVKDLVGGLPVVGGPLGDIIEKISGPCGASVSPETVSTESLSDLECKVKGTLLSLPVLGSIIDPIVTPILDKVGVCPGGAATASVEGVGESLTAEQLEEIAAAVSKAAASMQTAQSKRQSLPSSPPVPVPASIAEPFTSLPVSVSKPSASLPVSISKPSASLSVAEAMALPTSLINVPSGTPFPPVPPNTPVSSLLSVLPSSLPIPSASVPLSTLEVTSLPVSPAAQPPVSTSVIKAPISMPSTPASTVAAAPREAFTPPNTPKRAIQFGSLPVDVPASLPNSLPISISTAVTSMASVARHELPSPSSVAPSVPVSEPSIIPTGVTSMAPVSRRQLLTVPALPVNLPSSVPISLPSPITTIVPNPPSLPVSPPANMPAVPSVSAPSVPVLIASAPIAPSVSIAPSIPATTALPAPAKDASGKAAGIASGALSSAGAASTSA
ncbi:hypothetical protein NEOLEDRAFT_1130737 [Neolentinus lepideus HHB14362 ss-1]|uniref:Uncharacterized protein n=1 Tax=Neolentinus lepideus HHB14362 ss-1 TaxID=1314782 RepID=A0A165U5K6_9AGAM|nr:hypothetical protein NEOLEDRAFT_1130737 [Neolentinus lepideus HHB14362 ss-1]